MIRIAQIFLGLFCWMAFLSGCSLLAENPANSPADSSQTATEPVGVATSHPTEQAVEMDAESDTTPKIVDITIIYTNDEHGWMQGMGDGNGAAEIVGLWRDNHGCETDDDCLILSGGDMWTGPAISTWFKGESMADVMNAMGYDAAAIGNHEFDFGLDQLEKLVTDSSFPMVSANIRYESDGAPLTDLGIPAFAIVEEKGVKIGIIGLTTTSTPVTTNPANVGDFEFIDYVRALREVVPLVEAAGADFIVAPGHICLDEVGRIAMSDVGINMVGGGHCNELFAEVDGATQIIQLIGGFHLTTYAFADVQFDTANGEIIDVNYGTERNSGGRPDATVAGIIDGWVAEAEDELNLVVGYLDQTIERRGLAMQNLITYAWLDGYPSADFAATNLGGMRSSLRNGEITLADIIGVMPFDNVIFEVELTGDEFETIFDRRDDIALAGIYRDGSRWIVEATGQPLEANQTYSVLVNDFMFGGGDGYQFARYDDGYNTAIDWRQPVIDWLQKQNSSSSSPVDDAIDQLGP